MSMSMWSLRWHFTNKSITGAPYSIKSYSLSHSGTLWWRVRWLKQCRLEVAAELQQWWHRTNRRRKSIPRSSSSHREGSITQRDASCGEWTCSLMTITGRLGLGSVVAIFAASIPVAWSPKPLSDHCIDDGVSRLPIFWVMTNSNWAHITKTSKQHTHTQPFNGPLSGTTQVSRYQKGKTNLDFTEAKDSEWQWQQLGHMQICTSFQTNNHASTPPLSFYRPDALPAAKPTALKHWRNHNTLRKQSRQKFCYMYKQ